MGLFVTLAIAELDKRIFSVRCLQFLYIFYRESMMAIVVTLNLKASMRQYHREFVSLRILYQFALFNETNNVRASYESNPLYAPFYFTARRGIRLS